MFQKIFKKKIDEEIAHDIGASNAEITKMSDIIPRSEAGRERAHERSEPAHPLQFLAGCGHSVGLQRDKNQDTVFAMSSTLASDSSDLPIGLYIVADGMGGHQKGEVASEVAVRILAEYLLQNLYLPLIGLSQVSPEQSFQEIMHQGMAQARQAVAERAPDGGTTLTAVLLVGNHMTIAHIGDSRAYLISLDGQIKALTHDHSLVKRLEELGQLTSEESATHPQRNVLYRALGQGDKADPDIISQRLPSSGFLLLCSDGLWGVVSEAHILQTVITAATVQEACQALVDAANEAGGPDNISVILVQIPDQTAG